APIALLAAVMLAGFVHAASPDRSPSPDLDRVVRLWAAATGGLDRIHALRTVRMTGRITFGTGSAQPFSVTVARPGKIRTEVTFPEGNWLQVFDGRHGWVASPFEKSSAPAPMSAEQERNAPEQADI